MSDRPDSPLPTTIEELAREMRESCRAIRHSIAELFTNQQELGGKVQLISDQLSTTVAKQVLDHEDLDELKQATMPPTNGAGASP
jgi:hypothetical protein